ncbi:hypothetical protein X737_32935 [Mesorhizobium sp. L48C026A00]|nr:hypothetical protein X737_32935 [Mesorhizobium sp. L48C026A00]
MSWEALRDNRRRRVPAVMKAGCDICAIGHHGYVLGDVDLSPAEAPPYP